MNTETTQRRTIAESLAMLERFAITLADIREALRQEGRRRKAMAARIVAAPKPSLLMGRVHLQYGTSSYKTACGRYAWKVTDRLSEVTCKRCYRTWPYREKMRDAKKGKTAG